MADNIWAIPLALTDFNVIVALLGGFISLFGLVSYLLKENYYLSEARKSYVPSSYPSYAHLSRRPFNSGSLLVACTGDILPPVQ